MAENAENKSKRDLLVERLQGRFPEKEFTDDDVLYEQIGADYDDYDNQLNDYKTREQSFADMFTADPRSARLMMEWKSGQDPTVALVRLYGTDIKDVIDDPEKQEEIAAANKEYMERVAKESEYEEMYKNNLQESIATLDKIKEEKGLSDEDMDKAMEWLVSIFSDAIVGKFAPETLGMALKAIGYDKAVAQAAEEAEVKGRNAKIEEKLRKMEEGDGTASLDSKNANVGNKVVMPSLGALDRLGGDDDIYTRGGYKRTSNA